jgi:hypothetical protein
MKNFKSDFFFIALVDPGKIDIPIVKYAGPLKQQILPNSKTKKLGKRMISSIYNYL